MHYVVSSVVVPFIVLAALLGSAGIADFIADGEPTAPALVAAATDDVVIEAESLPGAERKDREHASGTQTVALRAGATATFVTSALAAGDYDLYLNYSNDGPVDRVSVAINSAAVRGEYALPNTREIGSPSGTGWDVFASFPFGRFHFPTGQSHIHFVIGSESDVIEFDALILRPVATK